MRIASGNLLSVVESIQTTNHGQAMIYGLRRGLGLLVQLMPNIVQQGGFSDRGKGLMLALKPTSEMKQVWTYSANMHRGPTIENLAEHYVKSLRAIIAHCQSTGAGGFTPSDFANAGLGQKEIDKLLSRLGASQRRRSE